MYKKLLLSLFIILSSASTAIASTLVIDPNGSKSVWDIIPTAAQVCPGAVILQLPSGYNSGQLQYYGQDPANPTQAIYVAPPPPPASPPQPDVSGFLRALNDDPLVSANSYTLAFQMSGLLALFSADMSGLNLPAAQDHWAAAKSNYGSTWLTEEVQAMILGYAVTFSIPLAAQ